MVSKIQHFIRINIIFLLAFTIHLNAQKESRAIYYLNAGISIPLAPGEFYDAWGTGKNFGGGIGFHVEGSRFIQQFYFDYSPFEGSPKIANFPSRWKGTKKIWTVSFNLRTYSPRTFMPYLSAGLSAFFSSARLRNPNTFFEPDVDKEVTAAFRAGGGIEYKWYNAIALFADSAYMIGFTQDQPAQLLPVRAGMVFYF